MILPTLPDAAKQDIRDWNRQGKKAARRILDPQPGGPCPNCQGLGQVVVSFLGFGPTPGHQAGFKPSTWVQGEGWYVIEDTKSYPCPVCSGVEIVRMGADRPAVPAAIKQVAEQLTMRKDLEDG
jgi:hypothetical protein